jgi:hypothetical protein
MNAATEQPTVKQVLARMDEAWNGFSRAIHALPPQLLEQKLGEHAWTRKQMLAHVAVWHDLAGERLAGFLETGQPVTLEEDDDTVNARAARNAVGRTSGEVLLTLEESYRHLRRQVALLTDEQLAARDAWAARTVAGNTYGHYGEHAADVRIAR